MADIAALQTDLTTHAAALSEKIGREVHPAVAFLDLMGLTEPGDEGGIDEFCTLKKISGISFRPPSTTY